MLDRIRSRVGLGGDSVRGSGARTPERHLTRREREHRQRQLLLLFTGVAALIVVLALAIGAFYQYFWLPRQTLASVNGTEIRRSEYLKVRGYEIRQEFAQLSQQLQFAQADQQPQMQARLAQLQQELAALEDGDVDPNPQTISDMIDDQIVLDNLDDLGISISDTELDQFVLGLFAPVPLTDPTPVPTVEPTAAAWATETSVAFEAGATATVEAQATAAAEATLDPNVTPDPNITPEPETTPEGEETPIPVLTPDAEGTSEPDATPDQAGTPDPNVTPDPDAEATGTVEPTLTPNAEQAVATSEASFGLLETNFLEPADMSRGDFERLIARPALARQRVQEQLAADVSTRADQAHLAHILVATQEAAQELIDTRLQEEEFADVATEVSIDEQSAISGGDLGWNTREAYVPEFAEAAFALEEGEISEPVQTQFGWHIIQMIEREEDRPLTIQALNQQKQAAFQTWLEEQREEAEIETDVTLPRDEPQGPPQLPPIGG